MQKYDRRSEVISDREIEYWNQLNLQYMTEESDGDDEEGLKVLVVHKLKWRSQSKQ